MPTSFFDSFTTFINSPPVQVAAGSVPAGIVWKFFERVEAVLNDETKLKIAMWLLGVEIGRTVESWPVGERPVAILDVVATMKWFSRQEAGVTQR
jgi:ligand-binding SRPBCC domain-containing protein